MLVPLFVLAPTCLAQTDEICGEAGGTVWMSSSFVYGKVMLHGFEGRKLPKITVTIADRNRNEQRHTIDRSGNFCFRDVDASGGSIVIDVEGLEVARRRLPSLGPKQHREDFDVYANQGLERVRAPSTISVKHHYPREGRSATLFENADSAEQNRQREQAIRLFKEVVAADPQDFIAWARLGGLYFEKGDIPQAGSALKRSISLKPDFAPAMINLGRIYLIQKRIEPAIELLEGAVKEEPEMARAYQLLGEAYLLARKGTLGVQALNEAIRLDPVGMAVCHLLIARLYDLAGAKHLASREYRLFLEKVADHPDRKKFERYVRDNPEKTDVN
ncbi:MAG TPA: tetratricopeptide repeat protein [Pyrinomonadaceae bacterium]|nr:tetratricopeptide repeat protein [Pyrinomonadaceae bacterium]